MASEMLAEQLDRLARKLQARPVAEDVSLSGRILRMLDAQWWRRNLRRELCLQNEAFEHAAGRVRRREQCYATDHAVHVKAKRAKANRAVLESLEVINEEGNAFNLSEIADRSISNPKLRRGELMVRCRGFEDTAEMLGHAAVFLTLTCPSRFHRFDARGQENVNWDGSSPKAAQNYLSTVWAKIRAEWKRQGFAPYGFRVAEPHHDACPHWHALLFVPPEEVGAFDAGASVKAIAQRHGRESTFACAARFHAASGVVGVAGAYALADSPAERGALKHRFTVERIDFSKGSATGYIAKYIAKNIDGEKEDGTKVGLDYASGKAASDSARRVKAWASTWGIRQFQQIGGPSVTVWRELRRLGNNPQHAVCRLGVFEAPRAAADQGLWGLFWFLQGGPEVARKNLSLRPMYATTGEGRYGEAGDTVRGVWGRDESGSETLEITRKHTWRVQPCGQAASDAIQARHTHALVHAREQGFADVGAWEQYLATSVLTRSAEGASTWTRVNNCTAMPIGPKAPTCGPQRSAREETSSYNIAPSRAPCGHVEGMPHYPE